jgi:hypothetical protein
MPERPANTTMEKITNTAGFEFANRRYPLPMSSYHHPTQNSTILAERTSLSHSKKHLSENKRLEMRAGTGTGTAFTHPCTFKESFALAPLCIRLKTVDTVTASNVQWVRLFYKFRKPSTFAGTPLAHLNPHHLVVIPPSYHSNTCLGHAGTDDDTYEGRYQGSVTLKLNFWISDVAGIDLLFPLESLAGQVMALPLVHMDRSQITSRKLYL